MPPFGDGWHPGNDELGVALRREFWWLIFPLGGMIGGGIRAVAVANERRAERRLERYRIKQQTKIAMAAASGRGKIDEAASRRELSKLLAHHDRIDARWLDYEMDVARLLDFPMMTDMRQPLTVAFHKARSHADLLRPATVDDAIGDRGTQLDYRDAVHDYAAAFDVAEADAIRRRRSDFSAEGQQRLERAVSAACGVRRRSDPTRTPERLRQGAPRARWADGVARHHARRNRAPDRRGDRGLTAASRPESRRVDQRYR
jgi:hypothetical protein